MTAAGLGGSIYRWNPHRNDLDQHCPWSGRDAPDVAALTAGARCPAACPDSHVVSWAGQPYLREEAEGVWSIEWPDGVQRPYTRCEAVSALETQKIILLCDECYELIAGLEEGASECAQRCGRDLDHDGLCHPLPVQGDVEICGRCGRCDRLHQVHPGDADDPDELWYDGWWYPPGPPPPVTARPGLRPRPDPDGPGVRAGYTIAGGDSGAVYRPWTNGSAAGFEVTSPGGRREYVYLSPGNSGDGAAGLSVCRGTAGDPAADRAVHHYDLGGGPGG